MAVTRDDTEFGRGKDDPALEVVRECIADVIGLEAHVIEDPERNRRHGDLELVGTAECKGQPIDPDRYDHNVVEVFEDTTALGRHHHRGGFSRTAEILGLSHDELAHASYRDDRDPARPRKIVGPLSHVSASLESIAGSDMTIYANPDPERTFVYFYTREFLLHKVRDAICRGGLRRGMGNAHENTFAVLVPVSPARWHRVDGRWRFVGDGQPPVHKIRAALTRMARP